jgi:hypothetical protein
MLNMAVRSLGFKELIVADNFVNEEIDVFLK